MVYGLIKQGRGARVGWVEKPLKKIFHFLFFSFLMKKRVEASVMAWTCLPACDYRRMVGILSIVEEMSSLGRGKKPFGAIIHYETTVSTWLG